MLYVWVLFVLELNPSDPLFGFTNAANWEFCEVLYEGSFQVYGKKNDEMRWRMDKSSSLGMPMSPQDILKKYKRQSLGITKASPSSSTKKSGHVSIHYIFIASYSMCCSWIIFVFVFSLV